MNHRLRALALLAASFALSVPTSAQTPSAVLVELASRGGADAQAREGWTVDLVVRRDGSFEAGGRAGRLERASLRRLRAQLARTRLSLERRRVPICMALPVRTERIRTQRGELTWFSPCSRAPDPSVLATLELVHALVNTSEPSSPSPTTPPGSRAPAAAPR